jgi:hypothetical protein
MTVGALDRARHSVRRGGTGDWLERSARLGFAARGLLYLTVAFLALGIVRGQSDERADKQGAVRALADTRFGGVLLVVLLVGFIGMALWRAAEAAWGKREERDDKKRAAKRAASAGKAVLYLALAATAGSVLLRGEGDAPGAASGQRESSWTARILDLPAGRLIVALLGAAIMAIGVWFVVRGARQKFEKHLDTGAMRPGLRKVAKVWGTLGHAARGVVAALAGLLLVKAALDYDPQEAKGIDGTLRTIAAQPNGKALLLVAAFGLAAFGLYSWIESRYRRIDT